jgi:perosamine synthetase
MENNSGNKNDIPVFKIPFEESDLEAVAKVLRRGMEWTNGPEVTKLEEEVAKYIGTKYCACFNSGTAALHTMLLAHGIGKDDDVIVPSFTFIATANAVKMTGATPIFADIEPTTYGLDVNDIKSRITDNTKAIILVHYAGCPAFHTREIVDFARKNNILLLEDAAQSFGADIHGRKTGTFGSSAIFSMCQNKNITSLGEGGLLTTNNQSIYETCKIISAHGRTDKNYFGNIGPGDYTTLGYNYRLSSVAAAIGLSQLSRVDDMNKTRRLLALLYKSSLPEKITPMAEPKGFKHVYQHFPIECKDVESLQKHLLGNGVMTKSYCGVPVHKTTYYKSLGYDTFLPVTDKISKRIVSLPMYPGLSNNEIMRIVKLVDEV